MSELYLIEHPEILSEKKIALYGASGGGKELFGLLEEAGISPECFCDSKVHNNGSGERFCGKPVISPNELKRRMSEEDFCILISSQYVSEILEFLELEGMLSEFVYTSFSAKIALWYAASKNYHFLSPTYCEKVRLQKELFCSLGRDMSYEFDNSMTKLRFDRLLASEKDIVLAFQPPKVGSTSVFRSINEQSCITMHFHDLEIFFENINLKNRTEFWKQCLRVIKESGRKFKIITGVREPIIRDISGYFQVLDVTNGMVLDTGKTFEENLLCHLISSTKKEIGTKEGENYLNFGNYLSQNRKYGVEFDWYILELEKYFGINLMDKPFNKEKGYQIYRNEFVEVFVYKLEYLSILEMEIGKFIGQDDFCLQNSNTSSKKRYDRLYREVMAEISLPKEYIDFYYAHNCWMDYFYSEKEKETFLQRWKE